MNTTTTSGKNRLHLPTDPHEHIFLRNLRDENRKKRDSLAVAISSNSGKSNDNNNVEYKDETVSDYRRQQQRNYSQSTSPIYHEQPFEIIKKSLSACNSESQTNFHRPAIDTTSPRCDQMWGANLSKVIDENQEKRRVSTTECDDKIASSTQANSQMNNSSHKSALSILLNRPISRTYLDNNTPTKLSSGYWMGAETVPSVAAEPMIHTTCTVSSDEKALSSPPNSMFKYQQTPRKTTKPRKRKTADQCSKDCPITTNTVTVSNATDIVTASAERDDSWLDAYRVNTPSSRTNDKNSNNTNNSKAFTTEQQQSGGFNEFDRLLSTLNTRFISESSTMYKKPTKSKRTNSSGNNTNIAYNSDLTIGTTQQHKPQHHPMSEAHTPHFNVSNRSTNSIDHSVSHRNYHKVCSQSNASLSKIQSETSNISVDRTLHNTKKRTAAVSAASDEAILNTSTNPHQDEQYMQNWFLSLQRLIMSAVNNFTNPMLHPLFENLVHTIKLCSCTSPFNGSAQTQSCEDSPFSTIDSAMSPFLLAALTTAACQIINNCNNKTNSTINSFNNPSTNLFLPLDPQLQKPNTTTFNSDKAAHANLSSLSRPSAQQDYLINEIINKPNRHQPVENSFHHNRTRRLSAHQCEEDSNDRINGKVTISTPSPTTTFPIVHQMLDALALQETNMLKFRNTNGAFNSASMQPYAVNRGEVVDGCSTSKRLQQTTTECYEHEDGSSINNCGSIDSPLCKDASDPYEITQNGEHNDFRKNKKQENELRKRRDTGKKTINDKAAGIIQPIGTLDKSLINSYINGIGKKNSWKNQVATCFFTPTHKPEVVCNGYDRTVVLVATNEQKCCSPPETPSTDEDMDEAVDLSTHGCHDGHHLSSKDTNSSISDQPCSSARKRAKNDYEDNLSNPDVEQPNRLSANLVDSTEQTRVHCFSSCAMDNDKELLFVSKIPDLHMEQQVMVSDNHHSCHTSPRSLVNEDQVIQTISKFFSEALPRSHDFMQFMGLDKVRQLKVMEACWHKLLVSFMLSGDVRCTESFIEIIMKIDELQRKNSSDDFKPYQSNESGCDRPTNLQSSVHNKRENNEAADKLSGQSRQTTSGGSTVRDMDLVAQSRTIRGKADLSQKQGINGAALKRLVIKGQKLKLDQRLQHLTNQMVLFNEVRAMDLASRQTLQCMEPKLDALFEPVTNHVLHTSSTEEGGEPPALFKQLSKDNATITLSNSINDVQHSQFILLVNRLSNLPKLHLPEPDVETDVAHRGSSNNNSIGSAVIADHHIVDYFLNRMHEHMNTI